MSSNNVMGLGKWRGAILAVALPGMLFAFATGCKKSEEANTADAETAATPDTSASSDVEPPPPVVSGDPDIPVNEAMVGTTPVPADYAADTAPPTPLDEEKPAPPEAGNVWVPGYWWWSTPFHRYVWVGGAWRNPPPEQTWTPGLWTQAGPGKWVWMPGFWGTAGAARPVASDLAPPPPRVETWGAPPSPGMFWTRGYYAWRDGAYVWVPGVWERPPSPGLEWVAASYYFSGGHYYYHPGRWDHDPMHRGTAYMPDINVRPGGHYTPVAVPPSVVVAHTHFVTAANHAVAMGGTRNAHGGFTFTGGVHPGGAVGHNPPTGGGTPPSGNEPRNEPRLAPGAGNDHPGAGGPGTPPGASPHPTTLTPENHPVTPGGTPPGGTHGGSSSGGGGEGHGGGHGGGSSSGGHGGHGGH
jgi:hypothetical protein